MDLQKKQTAGFLYLQPAMAVCSQGQRPWRFAEKIFDLEWKSESFLLYILSFIIICIENKKLISYE